MPLILGVDSSTQSTKALLVDSDDGTVIERGTAAHPPGTEVDPRAWLTAYDAAASAIQGKAAAIAVGGQQHGMVALDADGVPVRDALLWNDTRSAHAAEELIEEMGGPAACAEAVGSVLVASFTATKLRWLGHHEPDNAARVNQVLLPHDYVSQHIAAPGTPAFTDRGDASGTGYFSTKNNAWRPDLATSALGHDVALPTIIEPGAVAGQTSIGQPIAGGTGDNMAAALGLDLQPGDVVVSIGTSGVASAITDKPVIDPTGLVTGFADAAGGFLPIAVTINAAKILDLQARLLGVTHDELSELALSAPSGAHGVTLSPYYGGERTPNRPTATGTWNGLSDDTTRADLARAAFEALFCSLADVVEALRNVMTQTSVPARADTGRILLVGGATRSPAVRALAPAILGQAIHLPPPDEYVALGAARQAAWALAGTAKPPTWPSASTQVLEAEPTPNVRETYAQLRDRTALWS